MVSLVYMCTGPPFHGHEGFLGADIVSCSLSVSCEALHEPGAPLMSSEIDWVGAHLLAFAERVGLGCKTVGFQVWPHKHLAMRLRAPVTTPPFHCMAA